MKEFAHSKLSLSNHLRLSFPFLLPRNSFGINQRLGLDTAVGHFPTVLVFQRIRFLRIGLIRNCSTRYGTASRSINESFEEGNGRNVELKRVQRR